MELLTPFDFLDLFAENQRVAVIGNAPTLKTSGMGSYVDNHDIIIRFNDCHVHGYEKDVGSRTDILICNPYAETRPLRTISEEPAPQVVFVLSPQTRRANKAEFLRWAGKSKVLFSYTPDLRINTVKRDSIALTTGTYGLSLIHNLLKPRCIFLSGFTMFAKGTEHHYWTVKSASGLSVHSPETEARVFSDLINSFKCRIEATPDIFLIGQSSKVTFAGHVVRIQADLSEAHR